MQCAQCKRELPDDEPIYRQMVPRREIDFLAGLNDLGSAPSAHPAAIEFPTGTNPECVCNAVDRYICCDDGGCQLSSRAAMTVGNASK